MNDTPRSAADVSTEGPPGIGLLPALAAVTDTTPVESLSSRGTTGAAPPPDASPSESGTLIEYSFGYASFEVTFERYRAADRSSDGDGAERVSSTDD